MKATIEAKQAHLEYKKNLTQANFDEMPPALLKQGVEVMVGEFKGCIVRHYHGPVYEIRLPGGVIATGGFEVL